MTTELNVCIDCHQHLQGISAEERGEPYPADVCKWLIENGAMTDLTHDTLEHVCILGDDGYPAEDCRCATTTFSWGVCNGCGSNLGGSRFAYLLADK